MFGVTVDQCEGCPKKDKERWNRCPIYSNPAAIWRLGCFFNTGLKAESIQRVRVGQQKQKKIKTRGI